MVLFYNLFKKAFDHMWREGLQAPPSKQMWDCTKVVYVINTHPRKYHTIGKRPWKTLPAESRSCLNPDGISPSSFGATSWSFPAMNVWFDVINPSCREGETKACGGDVRTSVGGIACLRIVKINIETYLTLFRR